jgi:ATP-dependent Lon protease
LAAQRAAITRVIAPKLNEPDLDEFPPHLLDDIEFVFVDTVDRVLDLALEPLRDADGNAVKLSRRRRPRRPRQRQPAAARER